MFLLFGKFSFWFIKNRARRMFQNLICEIFLKLTNSNTNDLELMKKKNLHGNTFMKYWWWYETSEVINITLFLFTKIRILLIEASLNLSSLGIFSFAASSFTNIALLCYSKVNGISCLQCSFTNDANMHHILEKEEEGL